MDESQREIVTKNIYPIDENGFLIWENWRIVEYYENEPYVLQPNEIDVVPPDGFFRHKWDGGKWVEGAGNS